MREFILYYGGGRSVSIQACSMRQARDEWRKRALNSRHNMTNVNGVSYRDWGKGLRRSSVAVLDYDGDEGILEVRDVIGIG